MKSFDRVALLALCVVIAGCGLPASNIERDVEVSSRDSENARLPQLTAGGDLSISAPNDIPDDPTARLTDWDDGVLIGQDSSVGPVSGTTAPTPPDG